MNVRPRNKVWQILLLILTFVFLAIWSWRKGADILIDFGTQLYIPWQITTGKVLFEDIAYLPGGPFSQLFNAAIFKIFGTSLTTLMVTNLAIFALLMIAMYRFFEKASDAICATAICFVVITVFGFSALLPGGNYNYVTPYSHETYHGLVLSAFAVMLLSGWVLHRRLGFVVGAGVCIGVVFLTKPDIFIAVVLCSIVAFAIFWREHSDKGAFAKSLGCFLTAVSIPMALTFAYFQQFQTASTALRSMAWAWVPLLTTPAAKNKYYTWVLGLDHPFGNMFIAFMHFIALAIAIALCAWCARTEQRNVRKYVITGLILILLIGLAWRTNWREGGRVLFFLAPTVSGLLIWHWWKTAKENRRLIPAILWSVFAVGMMAKMGFFSKIWHYGTFLGMPAVVLAIYFAIWFLPEYLRQWQIRPGTLRAIFALLLITISAKVWWVSNATYSMKTQVAGKGDDRVGYFVKYYDPTGTLMAEGLDWIEKNTPTNATLAVLPQGVMLNYLSRRINPTPYITFILPEWQAFGEENILKAYDAHRPDYIAITRFDVSGFEYGVPEFGNSPEYGLKTMQWIRHHYDQIHLIRYRKGDPFGIDILKLKSER